MSNLVLKSQDSNMHFFSLRFLLPNLIGWYKTKLRTFVITDQIFLYDAQPDKIQILNGL